MNSSKRGTEHGSPIAAINLDDRSFRLESDVPITRTLIENHCSSEHYQITLLQSEWEAHDWGEIIYAVDRSSNGGDIGTSIRTGQLTR